MAKQNELEEYDPFSANPNEIRRLVQDNVKELGFPALNLVSRSCGVPVSELGAFYNRAQPIPENYLPILYLHFFGNVSPDRAKQYGIEHEL